MRIAWLHELEGDLRTSMSGLRWLLIKCEDLDNATAAWMFAELDGTFIGIDHRGSDFKSGIHNRAIHLLLVDQMIDAPGVTKVVNKGELTDYLW